MTLQVRTILGGVVGTVLLTFLALFVAPMMGVRMNPPALLATMFEVPIFVGWVLHFMMGIMFAFVYLLFFTRLHIVKNLYCKGMIFGFCIFVIALIGMTVMDVLHPYVKAAVALLVAHLVYGMGVSKIMGE